MKEITIIIDGEAGELICPDPDYWHYVILGRLDPKFARINDKLAGEHKCSEGYTCG